MKRPSPPSPSSSSSSSSSSVVFDTSPKPKPKPKRAKKNRDAECPNSSRRSSIYRGVTRHRWTGRFEAHLWDKSSWNSIQNKKGKQVYLGAYDSEEAAARTYDLAALKYWGPETTLNFPLETYAKEIEEMQKASKEEYLASLRRQSSGFSRGVSKYRGVARHHHNGRWEARIGRVFGNKYLYLGTYNTQEEAAAAYDMAALEYRGANAVTNFDISNYIDRLKVKGIFPFPLNQTENRAPNSSAKRKEEETEARVNKTLQHEQEAELLQAPKQAAVEEEQVIERVQSTELPLCNMEASPMMAMEEAGADNNELAWSFCMDSGLAPFLDQQGLPIEKTMQLSDLLGEIRFEDDIDFMFDEVKPECQMLEETATTSSNEEDNGKGRMFSSSSPSSTTTSVSCN